MEFLGECFRRLKYLLNRRQIESDLRREMEAHRELMDEPARFGNTLQLREEAHDVWGWNWLDSAWQDLRIAARTLRLSPGFTVGATIMLTFGIALNLMLLQIYNAVFLRPIAARDIKSLVQIEAMSVKGPRPISYRATQEIRSASHLLSSILLRLRGRGVFINDSSQRTPAKFVSTNWFDELGYLPAAGRLFHEQIDGTAGPVPAVVLTHRFWEKQLSARPDAVGLEIKINDRPAVIVGILPKGLVSLEMGDERLYLPLETVDYFFPATHLADDKNAAAFLEVFGRLRPGVSPEAFREASRGLVTGLADLYPDSFTKAGWLEPLLAVNHFERRQDRLERRLVVIGFGFLSVLVLAVVCSNLSNLVLSRAIGRLRELSIRMALGSGRGRIMRFLVAESAVLAAAAAIIGFAVSSGAVNYIASLLDLPLEAAIDWRMILGTLAVALIALAVVGLLPACSIICGDLSGAMKDGGQNASSGLGRTHLRSLLIGVQVAGSCILLLLAALTARGVQRALIPGFDFDKVAVLDPPTLGGTMVPDSYWTVVRQMIASHPETEEMSFSTTAPFSGLSSLISGLPESPDLAVTFNEVEPQFFRVMRIPIVVGRNFEAGDDPATTAIVSRRLAMDVYGTLNAIGQKFPRTPWRNDEAVRTIIGVAEDAHLVQIEVPNGAEVYSPIDARRLQFQSTRLVVRARTDASLLLAPMREASRRADERLFIEARLLSTDFSDRMRNVAFMSGLASLLAAVTLMLACLGVFGVISYGASLRRKEISIRLALGAPHRSLLKLLMVQSAWPAFLGMLCGFVVGLTSARILESQQVFLGPLDVPILIAVGVVIATTCGVAALVPAMLALRTDIAQTLRND